MGTPRLIATWYEGKDRPAHATTVEAAVRAAFRRVLHDDYKSAEIHNEMGVPVFIVRRRYRVNIEVRRLK